MDAASDCVIWKPGSTLLCTVPLFWAGNPLEKAMARGARNAGYTTAVVAAGLMACTGAAWSAWPWFAALAEQSVTRSQTLTEQVAPGKKIVLYLDGDADAGAAWHLDRDHSTGLDLVSVDDLAPSTRANRGSASMVSPSTQRYLVTGKHPGTARLVFMYRNEQNKSSPPVRWTYLVDVRP